MKSKLEHDIINTAESFVNNFSDKGNFDYSVQSLQKLEDLLEELCEYQIDDDTLDSVSSMAGCYIFEVARRNYGVAQRIKLTGDDSLMNMKQLIPNPDLSKGRVCFVYNGNFKCPCYRATTEITKDMKIYMILMIGETNLNFQISMFASKNSRYLGSSSIKISIPAPM